MYLPMTDKREMIRLGKGLNNVLKLSLEAEFIGGKAKSLYRPRASFRLVSWQYDR